jgi:hypothetical protein
VTSRALAILAATWAVGLAVGGYEMYVYMTTPGELAAAPAQWPDATRLERAPDGATVVMFVTPACPCSRASLAELALVHGAARTYVVSDGAIPRSSELTWFADDGAEATRFAARTSGYVVAYDATGALRFAGGITGARGHVGANVGRDLLEAALADRRHATTHAVFGCAIGGA